VLQAPTDARLRLPGLSVAYSGSDGRVYRNAAALPRVFLVDRQRTVSNGDAALAAVKSPDLDVRRVAVTEQPLADLADEDDGTAGGAGTARLVSYGRERVTARTSARRPSLLVLTDVHYPGWTVRVDGRSAPLHRVDYLLRGTTLPPGRHRVEFRYEPATWRAGWIVSLVALLALGGLVVAGRRRTRPAAQGRPAS
jgi:Bacterial membrane protein YfhO